MLEILDKQGYFVVENLLSPSLVQEALNSFAIYYNHFKEYDPAFNPEGILEYYNAGWQKHCYIARLACLPVFKDIFGTDKLLTSVEGVFYTRKEWQTENKYKSILDWNRRAWDFDVFSTDQGVNDTPEFKAVRALVCLHDQNIDSHVFSCVEHSHHQHVFKNFTQDYSSPSSPPSWIQMNTPLARNFQFNGFQLKRIPLKAGSAVFWDARLLKCFSTYTEDCPGKREKTIMIPVSMQPLPPFPNLLEIENRNKALAQGRCTLPLTSPVSRFGLKHPRILTRAARANHQYCLSVTPPIVPPDSILLQQLHGLIPYP